MMNMRHAAAGSLVLSLVLLAGCQKKPAAVPDTATAPPPEPHQLTVHASDFAFTAPDTVPAGMTTIHLINDGPGLHQAQLVRLDSSKTMADLLAALKNPGPAPAWMVDFGGPNAVAPGISTSLTEELTPGNYAWICFVDLPGGVPHFMKGMERAFTVVPTSGPAAAPPAADITVSLHDFAFDFSTPLTSGQHTLRIETTPGQPHELTIVKLQPGKTAKDLMAYLGAKNPPAGPPPGTPIGGTAGLRPDNPVYFTADFAPGDYVLICFVGDAKDGKPHFMHGMMQTVTVS